jgi:hypothetical protein
MPFYLFYTWREGKCFFHLTCVMLRMFHSIYTGGWVMDQYRKFPPSRASNIPSKTWFVIVLLRICLKFAGLSVFTFPLLHWWKKNLILSGLGLLQEFSSWTTKWDMLGPVLFCIFRRLITVQFSPEWTVGEGYREMAANAMRWVVRWHVALFRYKRDTSFVSV